MHMISTACDSTLHHKEVYYAVWNEFVARQAANCIIHDHMIFVSVLTVLPPLENIVTCMTDPRHALDC
jgi:hypothetical protein